LKQHRSIGMGPEVKGINLSRLRRTLYSLTRVHAIERKYDILLKTLTLFNIVSKFHYSWSKKGAGKKWSYNNCLVKVSFLDGDYIFHLAKGHDFNLFLNPYFHEYDVTSLIWSLLKMNDIFIDVGAHAGLYTIIASRRTGINGKVISIEPNPENVRYLKLNLQSNRITNVDIIPHAAGKALGTMQMQYFLGHTALTTARKTDVTSPTSRRFEVKVITLDEVFKTIVEHRTVKAIKIDTEGFDLDVLRGSKDILKKTGYVVVEQNKTEVREYLEDRGFNCRTLRPSNYLLATNT
jgi:FkbM family methyltransferase